MDWPEEPFTHADLTGVSTAELRRAQRCDDVRTIVRGVFVASHVPDTIELRAGAVARVVQPHHVVTDRTAAWLHGVDVLTYAEHDAVPPVELCALRGRAPVRRDAVEGRTRDLVRGEVMELQGVRVTTPLRTALDLGCHLRRREAYAAMCLLARVHDFGQRELAACLPRFRGRRGVVQLRELVPLVDPRFESPREAWTFLAIHDAGLPLPEPQVWVEVDGVPTYRLDLAYRHRRVCIEYDGADAHDRTPEQRERDEARRERLRASGWTVVVVRAGDFTGDELDRWLGRLREALRPAYSNRRW